LFAKSSQLPHWRSEESVAFGDFVRIDLDSEGRIIFMKEAEGAVSRLRNLDENEGRVHAIVG